MNKWPWIMAVVYLALTNTRSLTQSVVNQDDYRYSVKIPRTIKIRLAIKDVCFRKLKVSSSPSPFKLSKFDCACGWAGR